MGNEFYNLCVSFYYMSANRLKSYEKSIIQKTCMPFALGMLVADLYEEFGGRLILERNKIWVIQ